MDDRPREKMREKGASALSNSELLAVILRSGTAEMNVIDLARSLLAKGGGTLNGLSNMSIERMMGEQSGIGFGKASAIAAALELGKRYVLEDNTLSKESIISPEMVYKIMIPIMKGLKREECWALFLNRANYLITKELLSIGGLDKTTLDNKVIVKRALDNYAGNVILVHNHPSGNPHPGSSDIRATSSLKEALRPFDIALMDHVIVSDGCYYSFADERMIKISF